jgi:hypothetical protein
MGVGLWRREGDAVEPDAEDRLSVNREGWVFLLELARKYG